MLRITVHDNPGDLTLQLEGRLAGPWVRELEACWQSTLGGQGKPILRFDLTGVTFIDTAGKAFLAARHAEGAEFVACGCWMRAVVSEIASEGERQT
jgi:anti-anti-sigma regulatory factor